MQLLAFPVAEKRSSIHFVENTVQLNHNDEHIKCGKKERKIEREQQMILK